MASSGQVIWLYGLPSSGKTTLAEALSQRLEDEGGRVFRLDGDLLRKGLCSDLGFSDQDRTENIRRAAEVAKMACQGGLVCICSFITPLIELRDLATDIVGEKNMLLVHVACSVEKCISRDVKGLYAKAAAGKIKGMTGLDGVFERPGESEFKVNSEEQDIGSCVDAILVEAARRAAQG